MPGHGPSTVNACAASDLGSSSHSSCSYRHNTYTQLVTAQAGGLAWQQHGMDGGSHEAAAPQVPPGRIVVCPSWQTANACHHSDVSAWSARIASKHERRCVCLGSGCAFIRTCTKPGASRSIQGGREALGVQRCGHQASACDQGVPSWRALEVP